MATAERFSLDFADSLTAAYDSSTLSAIVQIFRLALSDDASLSTASTRCCAEQSLRRVLAGHLKHQPEQVEFILKNAVRGPSDPIDFLFYWSAMDRFFQHSTGNEIRDDMDQTAQLAVLRNIILGNLSPYGTVQTDLILRMLNTIEAKADKGKLAYWSRLRKRFETKQETVSICAVAYLIEDEVGSLVDKVQSRKASKTQSRKGSATANSSKSTTASSEDYLSRARSKELDTALQETDRLEKLLRTKQSQFLSKEREALLYSEQNKELHAELRQARTDLDETRKEVGRIGEALQKEQDASFRRERENTGLIEKLHAKLDAFRQSADTTISLEEDLATAKQQTEAAERKLENARAEIEDIQRRTIERLADKDALLRRIEEDTAEEKAEIRRKATAENSVFEERLKWLERTLDAKDEELSNAVAALEAVRASSSATSSDTERVVKQAKAERDEAREEAFTALEEAKTAKEETKSAREEARAAKEQAKSAAEQANRTSEQARSALDNVKKAQEQVATLKKAFSSAQEDAEIARAEAKLSREEAADFKSELQTATKDREALTTAMQALQQSSEADSRKTAQRVGELQGELQTARRDLQERETELEAVTSAFQREKEAKFQQETSMELELHAAKADIVRQRDKISTLHETIANLEAAQQKQNDQLSSDLDAQSRQQEAQISRLRTELAKSRTAVEESEDSIRKLESDKRRLESDVQRFQTQAAEMCKGLEKLKAETTETIEAEKTKLDAEKSRYEAERGRYEAERSERARDLGAFKMQMADLQAVHATEIQSWRSRYEELTAEATQASASLRTLETQVQKLQSQLQGEMADRSDLQSRLEKALLQTESYKETSAELATINSEMLAKLEAQGKERQEAVTSEKHEANERVASAVQALAESEDALAESRKKAEETERRLRTELESARQSLEQQVAEARRQTEQAQADKKQKDGEVKQIATQLADAHRRLERSSEEAALSLEELRRGKQLEIEDMKRCNESLHQQVAEATKIRQMKEAHIDSLLQQLEDTVPRSAAALDEAATTLQTAAHEQHARQRERERADHEAEVSDLRSKLQQKMDTELIAHQAAIKRLEALVDDVKQEGADAVAAQKLETTKMREEVARAEKELSEMSSERTQLKSRLESLQEQLALGASEETRTSSSSSTAIKKSEEYAANMEKTIKGLEQRLADADKQLRLSGEQAELHKFDAKENVLLKKKLRHREEEIATLKRIAEQEAALHDIDLQSRREEFARMMPKATPSVNAYNPAEYNGAGFGGPPRRHPMGDDELDQSSIQHIDQSRSYINEERDLLDGKSVTSVATSVPSDAHMGFLFDSTGGIVPPSSVVASSASSAVSASRTAGKHHQQAPHEVTRPQQAPPEAQHQNLALNISSGSKALMPSPAMTELERAKHKEEKRRRKERKERKRAEQAAGGDPRRGGQGNQDQCATQ
ncbi:unnamed protein product [Amoebophrya sp. A25]|nr:unnamed protein product [Amoebophrya sp. A25]|eukprot:GSA25T00018464001.1